MVGAALGAPVLLYGLYKLIGIGQILFLSIPIIAALSLFWAERELGKQE